MGGQWGHVPVLQQEIVSWLQPVPGGIYVDATLGLGGHAEAILLQEPDVQQVYGFEWDEDAAEIAAKRLKSFGDRFCCIHASYTQLITELSQYGIHQINGLVADLGVSSLHLDRGERGFSFQVDAPLDMRMSRGTSIGAGELVKQLSEQELADLFFYFGEERQARRIARRLVAAREQEPIQTTRQLADLVADAVPRKYHPKKKHVATKVFQALRVAVNDEFSNITKLLSTAPKVMSSGARICMISFHSLEDRIVKQAFRDNLEYRSLTTKPVLASNQEITVNPRSRSAKLRVAECANI